MSALNVAALPKQMPTTPENLNRINAMSDSLSSLLASLYDRWQDEKDYEDINDYGKAIAAKLPAGFVLGTMSKRPFGFTFTIGTEATYRMTATASAVKWDRILPKKK